MQRFGASIGLQVTDSKTTSLQRLDNKGVTGKGPRSVVSSQGSEFLFSVLANLLCAIDGK
jgi:hypothetical protein